MIRALMFAMLLAGCATSAEAPAGPASLEITPGLQAPAQAQFYVDCIAQASEARSYDREGNVIRFHCDGAPAQRFFNGLAAWSAQAGSEISNDGSVWRFTSPMRQNPSFLDFCRRDGDGETARHSCTVVLNVGEFLAE